MITAAHVRPLRLMLSPSLLCRRGAVDVRPRRTVDLPQGRLLCFTMLPCERTMSSYT